MAVKYGQGGFAGGLRRPHLSSSLRSRMLTDERPRTAGYLRVIGIFAVIVLLMLGGAGLNGETGRDGSVARGKVLVKEVRQGDGGEVRHLLGIQAVTGDGVAHTVIVEAAQALWESLDTGDGLLVEYAISDSAGFQVRSVEPEPPPIDL